MKTTAATLIALYLLLGGWQDDLSAQVSTEPSPQGSVILKWLGTAGWEIQIGQTFILIDPFLTRGEANLGVEWKTDEQAVVKYISNPRYADQAACRVKPRSDLPGVFSKVDWAKPKLELADRGLFF